MVYLGNGLPPRILCSIKYRGSRDSLYEHWLFYNNIEVTLHMKAEGTNTKAVVSTRTFWLIMGNLWFNRFLNEKDLEFTKMRKKTDDICLRVTNAEVIYQMLWKFKMFKALNVWIMAVLLCTCLVILDQGFGLGTSILILVLFLLGPIFTLPNLLKTKDIKNSEIAEFTYLPYRSFRKLLEKNNLHEHLMRTLSEMDAPNDSKPSSLSWLTPVLGALTKIGKEKAKMKSEAEGGDADTTVITLSILGDEVTQIVEVYQKLTGETSRECAAWRRSLFQR